MTSWLSGHVPFQGHNLICFSDLCKINWALIEIVPNMTWKAPRHRRMMRVFVLQSVNLGENTKNIRTTCQYRWYNTRCIAMTYCDVIVRRSLPSSLWFIKWIFLYPCTNGLSFFFLINILILKYRHNFFFLPNSSTLLIYSLIHT